MYRLTKNTKREYLYIQVRTRCHMQMFWQVRAHLAHACTCAKRYLHYTRYGYHLVYYILISARGTPLEVLHTLLLGPYKYILRATMAKLSKKNNALSCLFFCLHFHHLASPVESQETLQSITSLLLVGILRHWHRWLSLPFHHSWLLLRLKCG